MNVRLKLTFGERTLLSPVFDAEDKETREYLKLRLWFSAIDKGLFVEPHTLTEVPAEEARNAQS